MINDELASKRVAVTYYNIACDQYRKLRLKYEVSKNPVQRAALEKRLNAMFADIEVMKEQLPSGVNFKQPK